MKRVLSLTIALAAAVMLCSCAADNSDGLETVVVNGKNVDLTLGSDNIEQIIGDVYGAQAESIFEPYGEDILLCCVECVDEATYSGEMYVANKVDSGEPVGVTVWRGMSADMSHTQYKNAYDGAYSSVYEDWGGDFDHYLIAQADGEILSPSEYEAAAEAAQMSAYKYLLSEVGSGKIEELVMMQNFFDGETCFYCAHYIFKSKNTKTE